MARDVATAETPAPAPITADQFNQLLAALAGSQQQTAESIATLAEAARKQMPENVNAPEVSVYQPTGEPRPELPCAKVWFGGFPLERDTLDVEELTLLRQLQPGEFVVTRADEEIETIPVEFVRSGTGALDTIRIGASTGKEDKGKWPSLKRVLREIVQQTVVAA